MTEPEWASATAADMRVLDEAWQALERRWDARIGLLCATVANCHRDPKKRAQPYRPKDFMPRTRAETMREKEAQLKAFFARLRN